MTEEYENEMNEAEENSSEANQETGPDLIREAFDAAVSGGSEDDAIKMEMIGAGATFKNVTRLFNQYMIDSGQAMSKEDKDQTLDDELAGLTLDTEDGFTEAVLAVTVAVTGATDKSAGALVRAWAKKNDVEFYKKPKGTGAIRNPFVTNFHAALIANPSMDKEGLQAVIDALPEENRINPQRWFTQHDAIRKMANAIAAKYKG